MSKKESNNNSIIRRPELLAPAGNFEKLVTAIHYGADAVYLGGSKFSLRARAGNFSPDEMAEAVSYVHKRHVKVYVTINVFAHNKDLNGLENYLQELQNMNVDGLIVSDPGILSRVRSLVPDLVVHLSTQANVTNYLAARFWFDQGVKRLNLARELSLAEIRSIRKRVKGELEVFVHGAVCISYSGRCMLSNYLTGRDANRGHCAHPCRYSYALTEEKRPGQFFPVEEDERGTYIFNSKDLCLLKRLPQLVATGIDSLKIEGRMKSIFYVGGVVRVYRAALDYLLSLDNSAWENPSDIKLPGKFMDEIAKTGTRGMTENFFDQPPGHEEMLYDSSRVTLTEEPVAVIRKINRNLLVEVRNRLEIGEEVEYMGKNLDSEKTRVIGMKNERGTDLDHANPGNMVYLFCMPELQEKEVNGIFRRKIER